MLALSTHRGLETPSVRAWGFAYVYDLIVVFLLLRGVEWTLHYFMRALTFEVW